MKAYFSPQFSFEFFIVKIHYDEKSSIVSMSVNLNQSEDSSKTTGFSKDDIQKSSHELFKIIWEANKVKKNFPRNRLINIFTIYDNERIPDVSQNVYFQVFLQILLIV